MSERVLIVAHGHPDVSKGGAEVAAYQLFAELRERGVDALFVGRSGEASHGGTAFSRHRGDRELLFHMAPGDYFTFQTGDPTRLWKDFRELLERFRPDVVHFHHYLHLGLEAIRVARNTLPEARIVLTLHEYLAICAHNGQMIKRETHQLCHRATPDDCARCMPERPAQEFFLRERYFKSIFRDVDMFVSPSEFLADRYRRWGLEEARLMVIENGQAPVKAPPARALRPGEWRGRLAFFGQINPYKGLDVLLEAMTRLPEDCPVELDVHGAMFYEQPKGFVERLEALREAAGNRVRFRGAYESGDLHGLMRETDWVVVPSVWWENSPMVIQEAFAHGRPVICSNIGGMAEKVRDGIDGLHFTAGRAEDLARVLTVAATGTERWERLRSRIRPPGSTLEQHLEIYGFTSGAPRRSEWPRAAEELVAVGAGE
jgi:glycosyltransferase involved in cell wall biosynthesis